MCENQGGEAKKLLDVAIHTRINNIQVGEHTQMIILYGLSQWFSESYNDSLR